MPAVFGVAATEFEASWQTYLLMHPCVSQENGA
jgi:hypothetical protein